MLVPENFFELLLAVFVKELFFCWRREIFVAVERRSKPCRRDAAVDVSRLYGP